MPTNPTWPATLPQGFLVDGYREVMPKTTIRTPMDAGPAKVRRRFTAGVRMLSGRTAMTREQTETLDTFFNTTLAGGALSFDWTHPRTQAPMTCRFASEPEFSPQSGGMRWIVTLNLEILP